MDFPVPMGFQKGSISLKYRKTCLERSYHECPKQAQRTEPEAAIVPESGGFRRKYA